jgi:pentatricopeptide repeat protein
MIGRASNHPHKNKDMEEAIKIFKKWKSQNVKSNI